jgi:hypothetical protein
MTITKTTQIKYTTLSYDDDNDCILSTHKIYKQRYTKFDSDKLYKKYYYKSIRLHFRIDKFITRICKRIGNEA